MYTSNQGVGTVVEWSDYKHSVPLRSSPTSLVDFVVIVERRHQGQDIGDRRFTVAGLLLEYQQHFPVSIPATRTDQGARCWSDSDNEQLG